MKFWKIVLAFCCSLIISFLLFVAYAFFSVGSEEDLGKGYQFIDEQPKLIIDKNHMVRIPPRIIELGWDDRFIVAVQKPDVEFIELEDLDKYPQIHEHIFYWIIDKDSDKIYGPLMYDEFKQKNQTILNNKQIWLNSR